MRLRVLGILVLLLAASVPVQGQTQATLIQDDLGDVEVQLADGVDGSQLRDRFDHVDVQALAIEEFQEAFVFRLTVGSLAVDDDNWLFEEAEWRVHFWHEETHYAIEAYRYPGLGGDPFYYAYVGVVQEDSEHLDTTGSVQVEPDTANGVLVLTVDRDDLPDDNGASPFPGRTLSDFYVESETDSGFIYISSNEPLFGAQARDRMPDEGAAGSYEVRLGVQQSAIASLRSPEPMRVSNGGATTIVYEVEASNTDDQRHTYTLSLQDVPAGWEVSLPFERFSLESNESRTFPVLLVTPSGHSHGGIEQFLLEMQSQRDDRAFGKLELGLRYTEIPQPAGHHPKMWFHSFEISSDPLFQALDTLLPFWMPGYMNAAEEDPRDSGDPIRGSGNTIPGLESDFWWTMYMSPSLRMGLDFDLSRTGTIEVPVHYLYVMQDAQLSGALYLYHPTKDDVLLLADILPSEPASFGPDETHTFQLAVQPRPVADFIKYETGMQMWLDLDLTGLTLGVGPFGPETNPEIMPGGSIELPLNEYRDPVSTFYRAVDGLRFDKDFVEAEVNPGKTRVFRVELENAGDAKDTVTLNLTGTQLDWARVLGKTSFSLEPGSSREVAVAVAVPTDVTDGAIADLALVASSQENPFRRAVVDFVAIVDTEADHPDDAGDVGKLDESLSTGKESPGFELVAILAILAALVAVLPRRR